MMRRSVGIPAAALLSLAVLVGGCATVKETPQIPQPSPLRVGVTPDYPPLIFKRGATLVGLEAELAGELARALGRPLAFVELRWEKLIPALLAEEIDIIMSGMSITRARELRVVFSEPYLNNGLIALMRRRDADKYPSPESITNSSARIGVKQGTTADVFVQQSCPRATRLAFSNPTDAASELRLRGIDLFIHDAYAIAWLVSENEADFTALWTLLKEDYLAWAMRRDDDELLRSVNGLLSQWKRDGTLNRVVQRWLPNVEYFGGIPGTGPS